MDLTKEFYESDREDFIHWALIASLTGCDITENMRSKPMNVTMQINGEEVNPLNTLKRLEEVFDEQVMDKAKEILTSSSFELTCDIQELTDQFNEDLHDKLTILKNINMESAIKDFEEKQENG